jgi:hypothetical protein
MGDYVSPVRTQHYDDQPQQTPAGSSRIVNDRGKANPASEQSDSRQYRTNADSQAVPTVNPSPPQSASVP